MKYLIISSDILLLFRKHKRRWINLLKKQLAGAAEVKKVYFNYDEPFKLELLTEDEMYLYQRCEDVIELSKTDPKKLFLIIKNIAEAEETLAYKAERSALGETEVQFDPKDTETVELDRREFADLIQIDEDPSLEQDNKLYRREVRTEQSRALELILTTLIEKQLFGKVLANLVDKKEEKIFATTLLMFYHVLPEKVSTALLVSFSKNDPEFAQILAKMINNKANFLEFEKGQVSFPLLLERLFPG
jgi:hypothetical protein